MEIRPGQFFSEPGRWKAARAPIAISLLAFVLYLSRLLRYPESAGLPVSAIAIGIVAIAELLPKDRERTATVLRLAGIGILVEQFVVTFR